MAGKLKSKATGNIGSKHGAGKKGKKGKKMAFNAKVFDKAKKEVFGIGNKGKVAK